MKDEQQPVARWQWVPVEPTDAMMDAAEACSNDWPRTTWVKAYAAMIAAAPPRPDEWLRRAMELVDELTRAYAAWLAEFIEKGVLSPHLTRLREEKDAARTALLLHLKEQP
ncbi:MAG: hypothetical protein JWR07_1877 [Nevskia sp.]|nr:hypothetical protein [Nevskia sp.]